MIGLRHAIPVMSQCLEYGGPYRNKETIAGHAAANPQRPWGNEMVMVVRCTCVGSIDQVSPQRAERGFFRQS